MTGQFPAPCAAIFVASALLLGGCSDYDSYNHVERPVPAHESAASGPIMAALSCIKQSGALRNMRIAVAIHGDGKPQGTTAVYAAETVLRAGGRPFNYYELDTGRAMRAFADAERQKPPAARQDAALPNFVLSMSFTSLDVPGGFDMDPQIGGGPAFRSRGASLTAVAEVYQPGSRAILRTSAIQRSIAFTDGGAMAVRFDDDAALVTGSTSRSDEQRVLDATRDVVALSVADALSGVHNVPAACRAEVEALLISEGSPQEISAYAPVANDFHGRMLRVRD